MAVETKDKLANLEDLKVVSDEVADLKDEFNSLGFSVIDGKLNVTYTIQEEE